MNRARHRRAGLAAALCAAWLAAALPAGAHDYKLGEIAIGHIWARPADGKAEGAGVFGPLLNRGGAADRLVRASTPAAARVRFRVVKDGEPRWLAAIPVPVGRPTTLAPWRRHLWLEGLRKPLSAGDRIPLTLVFEKAGRITVDIVVETERGH